MKHSITSFENELVQQILVNEVCLHACQSTFGQSGLGSHFTPFFYNLNFQKIVDSLHSLLISQDQNELSLMNYINCYKKEYPSKDIHDFEIRIREIVNKFKGLAPFPLRNKVGSHLDGDFTHTDFTNGYLMPSILNHLIHINHGLKNILFPFMNHALDDNPHGQLIEQINSIVDKLTIENAAKLGKSPSVS